MEIRIQSIQWKLTIGERYKNMEMAKGSVA